MGPTTGHHRHCDKFGTFRSSDCTVKIRSVKKIEPQTDYEWFKGAELHVHDVMTHIFSHRQLQSM